MEEEKNKKLEDRIFQNVFNGNSVSFFISSKINRILSAVYLITDRIKPNEPLRNFIRHKASGPDIMGIVIKDRTSANLAVENLLVLKKALETAHSVGLVSTMNLEVITNECDEIISLIFDAGTDAFTTNPAINQKFFSVEKRSNTQSVLSQRNESLSSLRVGEHKGQDKRHNVLNNNKDVNFANEKRNEFVAPKNIVSDKNSREDRVLSIVGNRGEVTIKDISVLITEFSEKTIQRELNSLVSKGVIKRTGERRWSRYSLV